MTLFQERLHSIFYNSTCPVCWMQCVPLHSPLGVELTLLFPTWSNTCQTRPGKSTERSRRCQQTHQMNQNSILFLSTSGYMFMPFSLVFYISDVSPLQFNPEASLKVCSSTRFFYLPFYEVSVVVSVTYLVALVSLLICHIASSGSWKQIF